ncbi:MAG: hypothetical protein GY787_07730, partial [Alteromonadales bacterium]|nr:hypothetical protein [Alteromonadales bacterium]
NRFLNFSTLYFGLTYSALATYSFIVTMFGALGGVLYCNLPRFALLQYMGELHRYQWEMLPFFSIAITAIITILIIRFFSNQGK